VSGSKEENSSAGTCVTRSLLGLTWTSSTCVRASLRVCLPKMRKSSLSCSNSGQRTKSMLPSPEMVSVIVQVSPTRSVVGSAVPVNLKWPTALV